MVQVIWSLNNSKSTKLLAPIFFRANQPVYELPMLVTSANSYICYLTHQFCIPSEMPFNSALKSWTAYCNNQHRKAIELILQPNSSFSDPTKNSKTMELFKMCNSPVQRTSQRLYLHAIFRTNFWISSLLLENQATNNSLDCIIAHSSL